MRKLFCVVFLAVLLCFTSIFGKEWSVEQKDVLASLNTYFSAVRQGNQKEIVSFWHPKFVGWDYAQALPMNYDAHLKMIGGIGKSFKFKKLEFNPLEVQIEGNIAIIHGNYDVIIQDAVGKEMPTSGPETITLVKKDNKWAMIGLVSKAKETPEEAKARDEEVSAELEKFRTQAKLEEQNRELCQKYTKAWNKGDYISLKEAYAPHYAYYFPSGNPKPMSAEETIEMIKGIKEGFPDCVWIIEEMVVAGGMVITRNLWKATHSGKYLGMPPTGKTIELSSMSMVRIIDGKRVEEREDYDTLPLMQQLGMELKPKEVK